MNIVAKSILIFLFIPLLVFFLFFIVVLMAIGWLFGAKIKVTDNKTKLPIGYVRWFTFHSYY